MLLCCTSTLYSGRVQYRYCAGAVPGEQSKPCTPCYIYIAHNNHHVCRLHLACRIFYPARCNLYAPFNAAKRCWNRCANYCAHTNSYPYQDSYPYPYPYPPRAQTHGIAFIGEKREKRERERARKKSRAFLMLNSYSYSCSDSCA